MFKNGHRKPTAVLGLGLGAMGRSQLSHRSISALTKPGRYAAGGVSNLYLVVTKTGAKSWCFLYKRQGRQREAGLGSFGTVTLAQAREKAQECQSLLAKGIDPIEHRRAATGATKGKKTFAECAAELIESKSSQWRSGKHGNQWRKTLGEPCEVLNQLPVEDIDIALILKVLRPVWAKTPETARRLRGRIEQVLDYAQVNGWRSPEVSNPARWKNFLERVLPARPRLEKSHHGSMPYAEIPGFIAGLDHEDISARVLIFLLLTCVRLDEVLGAVWGEFQGDVWTVPAKRTKMGITHRVPLAPQALAIHSAMAECPISQYVFPGYRDGRPLSGDSLRALLPAGHTLHGFRASFRVWGADKAPREICEDALEHQIRSKVELAYLRADVMEPEWFRQRKELMAMWANFVMGNSNE